MIEKFVEAHPSTKEMYKPELAELLNSTTILEYTQENGTEVIGEIMKIELRRQGEQNVDESVENYKKLVQASKNPLDEPVVQVDL